MSIMSDFDVDFKDLFDNALVEHAVIDIDNLNGTLESTIGIDY